MVFTGKGQKPKAFQTDEELKIYAVRNINLSIFPAEFISILGPSGSGKSTLMHIAGFLDQPTSGEIIFNGKKITAFNENDLAHIRNQQVGFVFQQFNLLPRTTSLDNTALPLIYSGFSQKARHQKAGLVLTQLGLGNRLNHHPNQLSGGQQQRVAIARALINNPSIIFADEPTGNLDTKSGQEIVKILKNLNRQGKTIIIVTHDRQLAKVARRIITIKDGKIIKDYANK